jgi:hypothetical protein
VPKREYLVINRIVLSRLKFFCDDTKIIEELFLCIQIILNMNKTVILKELIKSEIYCIYS